MASPIEAPAVTTLLESDFIWEYQSNVDPWDEKQRPEWTPYSCANSSVIEQAYQQQYNEIVINGNYRIDLHHYIQQHATEPFRQRSVRRRRCHSHSSLIGENESEEVMSRRERLSSFLGVPLQCSATADTFYYGSSFVHDWLLLFSEGKMTVTFDRIFPVLTDGLLQEGQSAGPKEVRDIETALRTTEEETRGKRSNQRIEQLQACCAKLYTKECYLYRIVNTTLRDDDRTKLHTLGPFCFLLFNYVGQHSKNTSSIYDRLQRVFRPIETNFLTLYRGDRASPETIEEYRQAAGNHSKHFKWLPFVSTSRKQEVAERFAYDVLYIMLVRSHSLHEDRFRDLAVISDFADEEEILLLPGVQFQVIALEFSNEKGIYLVRVKINSSYVSKLQ